MLTSVVIACLAVPSGASGAPTGSEPGALDAAVRYLQNVQNKNGGFPGTAGGASSTDFSSWVALALAAASINPQDQAKPGGTSLYKYLTRHTASFSVTTDYERNLLVAVAAGTNPRDFGGVNLVQKVEQARITSGADAGAFAHTAGSTTPGVNDTVFAILSLARIKAAKSVVANAVTWLLANQSSDGSWPAAAVGGSGDGDMTGAALEALAAAAQDGDTASGITTAEDHALTFLKTLQGSDGGFEEEPGWGDNTDSTAWIVQGLWAVGVNPRTSTVGAHDPLEYMASMQAANGSVRYSSTSNPNPIWNTAYVGPAMAGVYLPIAAVPRAVKKTAKSKKSTKRTSSTKRKSKSTTTSGGHGGSQRHDNRNGVLAGGGGAGAALFSRPKPQSQGKTAGGVRNTTSAGGHARRGQGGSSQHGQQGKASKSNNRQRGNAPATVTGRLLKTTDAAAGLKAAAPGLHEASAGASGDLPLEATIAAAVIASFLAGLMLDQPWPPRWHRHRRR